MRRISNCALNSEVRLSVLAVLALLFSCIATLIIFDVRHVSLPTASTSQTSDDADSSRRSNDREPVYDEQPP